MKKKTLIFVCTGNTCRSPMAAGLLCRALGNVNNWKIASAGICAAEGWPASANAVEALREKEIDISEHSSRTLTTQMILAADIVVTMTKAHRDYVIALVEESEPKVFLLKSFSVSQSPTDIYDPVGESLDIYRRVRDEIDAALPDLILFMMEKRKRK